MACFQLSQFFVQMKNLLMTWIVTFKVVILNGPLSHLQKVGAWKALSHGTSLYMTSLQLPLVISNLDKAMPLSLVHMYATYIMFSSLVHNLEFMHLNL